VAVLFTIYIESRLIRKLTKYITYPHSRHSYLYCFTVVALEKNKYTNNELTTLVVIGNDYIGSCKS
jgi:hypothetical protein